MEKIFFWGMVAVFMALLINSVSSATPSVSFLKKIPANANYSEFWFSAGNYNFLPVGASYFSPINGYAQFGLKAEKGKVLVATWRFAKDVKLACVKNPYLSAQQLANLYDYTRQCN